MNEKLLIILSLIFIFSIGCVYSQDTNDLNSTVSSAIDENSLSSPENMVQGSVSGDVKVITENPWNTTGELNYDIPHEAKDIKMANVYINVYCGSGSNLNYALDLNTSITTVNGSRNLGYEILQTTECSKDGTVYTIDGNDHVTRVYSDYQINYDVTDILKGLNGTSVKINVDSIERTANFDGRIKLIALVLAYDDGDNDVINYWIDYNQHYTKTEVGVTFNTTSVKKFNSAVWTNVLLSSTDASYKINNYPVTNKIAGAKGDYYVFNQWDVTKRIVASAETSFTYHNNGDSAKSALSVLTIADYEMPTVEINSITSEYEGIAYSGTVNALTAKINTNKKGQYVIRLFANGGIVNTTKVDLNAGNNNVVIIDPTIRPLDESSVVGKDNKNVNWTIEVLFYGENVTSKSTIAKVLYNGYLGSEYAYGIDPYKPFLNVSFTGDIVVDIKTDYTSSGSGGRTDVWNVNLDSGSTIAGGFIILPYNWFDYYSGNEDSNMIKATFNGKSVSAFGFAHDNPNIGWNMGYGVLIFDVSGLINPSGKNTLTLNKVAGNPALNPSALVYFYNTTGSKTINNLYMVNGYDLLLNDYNNAGRVNQAKSVINVNSSDINSADIYIFAAGAERNDGYVVINNNEFKNCWKGTSSSTDLFRTNITGIIKDSNEISFVNTHGTVSALPQFIVVNKNYEGDSSSPDSDSGNGGNGGSKPNEIVNVKVKTIVKAPKIKAKFKKSNYFKVTVKDANTKKALINVKIKIKVFTGKKSKTYNVKTNKKGIAKINTKKLKVGKHKVIVSSGDGKYLISAKSQITIKK